MKRVLLLFTVMQQKCLIAFLLGMAFLSLASPAIAYTFPGDLPAGCSGSGGSYTCGALTLNQNTTFSDIGNVSITVNGDLTIQGFAIGSSAQSATVTFNVQTSSGNIDVNLYSGATVYATINVISTSSHVDIKFNMIGTATLHGNLTANGNDNSHIYMFDSTIINGDVSLHGDDAGRFYMHSNATINGNLNVSATDSNDGTINLYSNNNTITGNVTAEGPVETSGDIGGCVFIDEPSSFGRLYLRSGSSTGSVCKGTLGACDAQSSYVYNYTGVTPLDCAAAPAAPAALIAEYHLDETSWDGTANEVEDSANYSGGPFDGQAGGSPLASAADTNPARTSGTSGTCGYANFSGANGGGTITLDNLPVDTSNSAKTSVSFWMYWDGTNLVQPIGWYEYSLLFYDGRFGFNTGGYDIWGISSSGLANGWHHVVATFVNANTQASELYIDGVKQTLSQSDGSPYNDGAYTGSNLHLSGWGVNRYDRFAGGRIDEVKVYNGALTASEVTADYNAVHNCPQDVSLVAAYHMDETSWNGSPDEVIDSSGNGYHGQAAGSGNLPNTAYATPALGSSTGTCAYGDFTGGAQIVQLPNTFPRLSGSLSITAWIKPQGGSGYNRIFVDDNGSYGYGFRVSSNRLAFYKRKASGNRIVQSSSTMNNDEWYFVAAVQNDANDEAKIYIYDQGGALVESNTATNFTDDYTNITPTGTAPSIGGHANYSNPFHGDIDEVRVYSGVLNTTEIETIRDTTRPCPSYVSNVDAHGFNCVALEETADNTGHLYTQQRGVQFGFRVVALNNSGQPETSFSTDSDKQVTLELVDVVNGNQAITFRDNYAATSSKTVTFPAGNSTGYVEVDKLDVLSAYRHLKCRVTDHNPSPAVVGMSSDGFAVRPQEVTNITTFPVNDDPNGLSTSTATTIKAGADFQLKALSGVAGHDGTFQIDHSKLSAHTGASLLGTLTGTFSASNPNAYGWGTAVVQYDEVGYFKIGAYGIYDDNFTQIDINTGDCTDDFSNSPVNGKVGCKFGNLSDSDFFGRFIPDHFVLTPTSDTPACDNRFTYYGQGGVSGQSALQTVFTLTAQNANNLTTSNYTGNFANDRFDLTNWNQYQFSATNLPTLPAPDIAVLQSGADAPSGSWLNGVATNISATHRIDRHTTAMAPQAVTINAQPTDNDGVTTLTNVTIAANSEFRYGRLSMNNAYGSDLLPLSIPLVAQYWNGSTYVSNTLDSCSTIHPVNITMDNYQKNLNACETELSGGGTMVNGRLAFTLSSPGNGNHGSVNLTTNLGTASGSTCVPTTTSATTSGASWFGLSNPAAKATFGLNKSPIIYMRENF